MASTQKTDSLERTLEVIGDKWTPLIISAVSVEGLSFCKIERQLEGISPRTLTQRLEMLQAEEILVKRQYCQHPPRYLYELTAKGRALDKVIDQMKTWGKAYQTEN